MLILSSPVKKHGHHRQFFFLVGRFWKFFSEAGWPKYTMAKFTQHFLFIAYINQVSDTGSLEPLVYMKSYQTSYKSKQSYKRLHSFLNSMNKRHPFNYNCTFMILTQFCLYLQNLKDNIPINSILMTFYLSIILDLRNFFHWYILLSKYIPSLQKRL